MKHRSPFQFFQRDQRKVKYRIARQLCPSVWMLYLPKLITVLTKRKPIEIPWRSLYPSLYHEVKHRAKRLGLEGRVTPQETRHSGRASIGLQSFERWTKFGNEERDKRCRQFFDTRRAASSLQINKQSSRVQDWRSNTPPVVSRSVSLEATEAMHSQESAWAAHG